MNTYLTTKEEQYCYGCLSCVYSCPTGAISIEKRFDEFAFPTVDTKKCINCDKCSKVCPNDTADSIVSPVKRTFALKHKNTETRKQSSSGGAFTAISDYLMDEGYKVYGAVFDESFHYVKHIGSYAEEDRNRMRISKYVESSLEGIYPEIKKELENSKKVFFTGTPCQVAGLKAFLSKPYDNLLTMDLVCNGLVSPKIFKDYIIHLSNNSRVSFFAFRSKENNSWENSKIPVIKCDDNTNSNCISYINNFLDRSIGKRVSCSSCKFASASRPADITVGDFWTIDWIKPDFKDETGVSLITSNTEKGDKITEKLKSIAETAETDKEKTIKGMPRLINPVRASTINDMFWKYYKKHSAEKTLEIYGGNSLKSKLMRKPFEYINAKLK